MSEKNLKRSADSEEIESESKVTCKDNNDEQNKDTNESESNKLKRSPDSEKIESESKVPCKDNNDEQNKDANESESNILKRSVDAEESESKVTYEVGNDEQNKDANESKSNNLKRSADSEEIESESKVTCKDNNDEQNKHASELESNSLKRPADSEEIESESKVTGKDSNDEQNKDANESESNNLKRSADSEEIESESKVTCKDSNDEQNKDANDSDENDGWVGPLPSEAVPTKKRKILPHEKLYLENIPDAESYEKSFMHRDIITHLLVTKTDFIITASCDGHLKFWKKIEEGIEFVKHFRSHLAAFVDLCVNFNGTLLGTASEDKNLKIFDVINFDMINMIALEFEPYRLEFIHSTGDAISTIAVSSKETNVIYIFDSHGTDEPLKIIEAHKNPVIAMKFNVAFETMISIDKAGILEYWQSLRNDFKFPEKIVSFKSKLDTSLYEFVKTKTRVTGLAITSDGKRFATISTDRKVRIFKFLTGKLIKIFDETIPRISEFQQKTQMLPNMEFGRRMAIERELEKSDHFYNNNLIFDNSGHFIIYSTMYGIKVINIETNRCISILGKTDNVRTLHVALFQGKAKKSKAAVTLEQEASENPTLAAQANDPTIFCTGFKKPRFYLYSRRLPSDLQDVDRDVFNEKPSKEDTIAVPEGQGAQRIYELAVLHTTAGDIHMKLFGKECPKTVENFCVHSRNGYYNGHIFHRVIKGFMIQTGDPTGTGTGGQSIWGHDFKDEFVSSVKHDRPYTVSMANAGPHTNGSQFFITVLPTPWLDNKHTILGRIVKGMEIVQNISNVKTNPKTDKPYDDVKIISIYLSNAV